MPNTRRRRFSVQNDIAGRNTAKIQSDHQNKTRASQFNTPLLLVPSHADNDPELKMAHNLVSMKKMHKNKICPNSSKNSTLEVVTECNSASSVISVKKKPTVDKDVAASSSNIDLFNILSVTDESLASHSREVLPTQNDMSRGKDTKQQKRERTPIRRENYPRQHRIKVRSPKRRMTVLDSQKKPTEKARCSIGTEAIDWEQEVEVFVVENVANLVEAPEEDERPSDHSLEDMCRICHGSDGLSNELGQLISACSCRGTVGRVHVKCLERWLTESGKSRCELCGTRYSTRRVHRYGVPRALVMWILSQNAKQLMVDSLGIMLMSPLAVLAAWLSGRTLAGLMTQESHVTPWPLASTFVLACMTLVCYYCWIVSAATRHALGWWIWYRSQYEVRLQFQGNEE